MVDSCYYGYHIFLLSVNNPQKNVYNICVCVGGFTDMGRESLKGNYQREGTGFCLLTSLTLSC